MYLVSQDPEFPKLIVHISLPHSFAHPKQPVRGEQALGSHILAPGSRLRSHSLAFRTFCLIWVHTDLHSWHKDTSLQCVLQVPVTCLVVAFCPPCMITVHEASDFNFTLQMVTIQEPFSFLLKETSSSRLPDVRLEGFRCSTGGWSSD